MAPRQVRRLEEISSGTAPVGVIAAAFENVGGERDFDEVRTATREWLKAKIKMLEQGISRLQSDDEREFYAGAQTAHQAALDNFDGPNPAVIRSDLTNLTSGLRVPKTLDECMDGSMYRLPEE